MGEWPHYKLGDLFAIKHGYAFKGEYFSGRGDRILLTPGNFREEGGLKLKGEKEKYYVGPTPTEFVLERGDLLIAMTDLTQDAPILGSAAFVPDDGRFLHNQRLGKMVDLKHDLCLPEFAFYLLNLSSTRERIRASASGATVRHTSPSRIYEVEVQLPSLKTQEELVTILSSYDELIENNQRRIRILEGMARSLYREWFVHFRFQGHKDHPRSTSPLGDIPNGWKISSLGEVTAKIGSGATPRGGKDAYHRSGISLIRSLNIYDYDFVMDDLAFIDERQASQLDNVQVQSHDVLLNITGASVARCSMVPSSILPARVNQHVAIIRADTKQSDPFFLLDTINNEFNKRRLLGMAQGGATREALTKVGLEEFQIVLPPLQLIREYGHKVGALHTQRELLSNQNHVLRQTRDLLLPRLLSGQIKLEAN